MNVQAVAVVIFTLIIVIFGVILPTYKTVWISYWQKKNICPRCGHNPLQFHKEGDGSTVVQY